MTNFTLKLTFNGENRFGVSRIRGMCQTRGLVVAFFRDVNIEKQKRGENEGWRNGSRTHCFAIHTILTEKGAAI